MARFSNLDSFTAYFNNGWLSLKKDWKVVAYLLSMVFVVNFILRFVGLMVDPEVFMFESWSLFFPVILVLVGLSIVSFLVGLIANVSLINFSLSKKIKSGHEALSKGKEFFLPGLGTSVIVGLFLVGLFSLFIVPGVIFSVYWYFVLYAVVFAKKSGIDALTYSFNLVRGRWWRTFGFVLVLGLIVSGLSVVVSSAAAGLVLFGIPGIVIQYVIVGFVDVFLSGFSVLAVVELFKDYSKRKVA